MAGYSVADVCNEVLQKIMWSETIGDIEEGTDPANALLLKWDECLKGLLRSAKWSCARKQAPMQLLADVTGNTASVGTAVPYPWIYEYEYPIDCVMARFVPWNWQNPSVGVPSNNIQLPQTPLNTGIGTTFAGGRIIPARFIVDNDFNYPPQIGAVPWDVPGVSPQGRTVILTNVKDATLVYTVRVIYPSIWDTLFRAAFVAYLASEVAGIIWAKKDMNTGLKVRDEMIKAVTGIVTKARAESANEGGPSTSDIRVDWMDNRRNGGGGGWANGYWGGAGGAWGAGDPGYLYGADSGLALANGAVF
jgi:hypothetical protein